MKRERLTSCLAAALLIVAAACGDDDGSGSADATPDNPDAAGEADSAPELDAADPSCDGNLMCSHGGELKVEYVQYTDPPFNGRNNGARYTAFLLSDAGTGETPDAHPMLTFGECNDIGLKTTWPTAMEDGREYIDVGEVIASVGDLPSRNVPVLADGAKDSVGREHPGGKGHFVFGVDDAPTYISDDSPFDILFTGSDEWPATAMPEVGFIPKEFALLEPAPGTGPIHLTAGEPIEFTYEVEESDTNDQIGFFVIFVVAGAPVIACPEIQDGSFTVSGADITKVLGYGATGTISRQTFVHRAVDLDVSGDHRRIDVIGVWCNVTAFDTAE